jgi:superfamily II DNA or RNA helicase
MDDAYTSFLDAKASTPVCAGATGAQDSDSDCEDLDVRGPLYGFQAAIVRWALRRRRAAVFAATGLGKSFSLLAYSDAVLCKSASSSVLVITPLCTAHQLIEEARLHFPGLDIVYAKRPPASVAGKVIVTNYENATSFPDMGKTFRAIVLDESSMLKHSECKTGAFIIEHARAAPYRLALSATPCPNDACEILNQADFLGVGTHDFLMANFFEKNSASNNKPVLRAASQRPFVEWLGTWSVWLDSPSDIGFDEDAAAFELPPMDTRFVDVKTDALKDADGKALTHRIKARKATLEDRVAHAARLIREDPDQTSPWVVWANLNDEARQLVKAIGGSVQEISGTDSASAKEAKLRDFAAGNTRVLVTKSRITGFGLNWQHCHRQIFVGLTDSYESLHQAIRRLWRFGQTRPVTTYLLTTEAEAAVRDNIQCKGREHDGMRDMMRARMRRVWGGDQGLVDSEAASPPSSSTPLLRLDTDSSRLIQGDCVMAMDAMMAPSSVDLAVFSPPFGSLYRYSDDPRDLSNCRTAEEFSRHVRFFARALFRVLKPGRLAVFHVMNAVNTRAMCGVASLQDTRGTITAAMLAEGFALHSEVCVYRCPVQAMIQTKAGALFYRQFLADAASCRQSLPDYLVVMAKPGTNAVPIRHHTEKHTLEDWKRMASCVWHVKHTDVINHKRAMAAAAAMASPSTDEEVEVVVRHPTPLALPIIRELVDLWSNPEEVVLDPFSGWGSTGLVCKEKGRRYVGIELNPAYVEASLPFVS